MLEDDFADCFLVQGWTESKLNLNLPDQLSSCSNVLKRLGKKIQYLRNDMEYLWSLSPVKDNIDRIVRMEKELEKLIAQEELSRANWLKSGDRNTKYFNSFASSRRYTNYIKGLQNLNGGDWCSEQKSLVSIAQNYFTSLFSSTNPSSQDISEIVNDIEPIDMNDILCALFSNDEVRRTVFDLHPSNSVRMASMLYFIVNFGRSSVMMLQKQYF